MVSGRLRPLLPLAAGALLVACASALPTIDRVPLPDRSNPVPPAASVTAVDGLTANDLLERSDAAVRARETVVVEFGRTVDDTFVVRSRTTVAPASAWSGRRDDHAGPLSVIFQISDRSAGGFSFSRVGLSPAASGPALTAARDPRILGAGSIEGRPAWVIWYRFTAPSAESPFEVWRTEWIDQDTHLLLQQLTDSFDPYGSDDRQTLRPRY